MDGIQWKVIDEYNLLKETKTVYLKFFTFVNQSTIRLPGSLISPNKIYAKMLLLKLVVESFNYMLVGTRLDIYSKDAYTNTLKADKELKVLTERYPELMLKVMSEFRPDNTTNSCIWR